MKLFHLIEKNLKGICMALVAVLLVAAATGTVCYKAGTAKAQAMLDAFGTAENMVTSDGVFVSFMPEYGLEPLSSFELEPDTVYRVRMSMPAGSYEKQGHVEGSTYYPANEITAQLFYPKHVKGGDASKMAIVARINDGEPLVGIVNFVATDDLCLIQGGERSTTVSCDVDFDETTGSLKIEFFTSATSDFHRPDSAGTIGRSNTHCDFFAY